MGWNTQWAYLLKISVSHTEMFISRTINLKEFTVHVSVYCGNDVQCMGIVL